MGHGSCRAGGGPNVLMLTDKKTVLVARSKLPKDMGSDCGRHVSVDDSPPREFRNHLSDWLAEMTEAAGMAAVVPEIMPTPSKLTRMDAMPAPQTRMPRVYQTGWSPRKFSDHSRASSRPSPWGWASWPGTISVGGGGTLRNGRSQFGPTRPARRGWRDQLEGREATPPGKNDILSAMSPRVGGGPGAPSPPPVMKVRFWGVRGSLPVPGAKTERYGGNTSCVEVRSAAGTRVVVDAGTGIRKLGKELASDGEAGHARVHLLISHTHWDHIQGLPYFAPLYQRGNKMSVYARKRDDLHLQAVFASQTHDPYFPVPFAEADAAIEFNELTDAAKFSIADVQVACARLNHPYIATAYRLTVDGASVVYVSDTAPFSDILFEDEFVARPPSPGAELPAKDRQKLARMREGVVRLCEGADLVIYDTMFTPRTTSASRTTATRARRTRSRSAARRAPRAWRCSITRPNGPTPRSTPSSPTRARPRTRRRSSWRSSPRTKDWTWSWGSADWSSASGACAGRSPRRGRRRCATAATPPACR